MTMDIEIWLGSPATLTALRRACIRVNQAVRPQDRQDVTALVHPDTWDELAMATRFALPGDALATPRAAYGYDIRQDVTVPAGYLCVWVEDEMDRAMRRASERGQVVNVVHAMPFDPASFVVPPVPTLRALLGHWREKLRGKRK